MNKPASKSARYKKGLWAEYLAMVYLWGKGYRILKLRYKTPVGEIDILARRKDVLVAVEVKARQNMDDALHAIAPRNKARVERALQHFIMDCPEYNGFTIRFDAITVCPPFSIRHLDNAWQACS